MNNKLQLLRKTPCLVCAWVPTGDAKKPLACVWAESGTAQPLFDASCKDEPLGVRLCA
jgi:hypothetical protein